MNAWVIDADAGWFGADRLERRARVLVNRNGVRRLPRDASIPRSARRVRVEGVLVPGLVDHHVHTDQIDVRALLRSGIAAVRDLGAQPRYVFDLARRARHDPGLPRVIPAGPFLTAPGGYPTDRPWAQEGSCRIIRDPDDAAAAVRDLAAQGARLIKVAMNADAGPVLGDAELKTVVHAAESAGLRVISHAQGAGQVESALRAGCHELAHTPFTHRLSDATVEALAARMAWTSTVDIHGWGKDTEERRTALDNLRRFHQAGGLVRYGTDLGNGPLPAAVNIRELKALTEAGLSPAQLLRSIATSRSELAVLPGNPLADPLVISRVTALVRAGRYVERTST
ncbi:amidohydrolase family protein (plasmid) [Embleya sp. NBC_00888]|uniref:amidohydrolase family protein n=1 Tax=Embleya sp. NBC_00888 TaxID=2975960 RepID=UPI002F91AE66|nr:amidohydrolase family protein [Embleya sp. NBC_00888]